MSDKTTKTKAELLEMLAEAVRNTQPQSIGGATQPEPIRDAHRALKRKTGRVPKPTPKTKSVRAPAGRKQRHR